MNNKAKYTDWRKRDDIKAELKVEQIILLAENDYPSQRFDTPSVRLSFHPDKDA